MKTKETETMSRTRQMIELFAPAVLRAHRPEHFRVTGFTCPSCNGNGWHWAEDTSAPGDYVKQACSCCGGSGAVDAEVTVEWKRQDSSNHQNA